jgi:hypothetical protein
MKSSDKSRSLYVYTVGLAVVGSLLLAMAGGCVGGNEGDRCNPDLSHNDCNAGLTCQQPSTCVENYCCPDDPSTSTNPYCNGTLCPAVDDAGPDATDAGTDAGSDDGAPE